MLDTFISLISNMPPGLQGASVALIGVIMTLAINVGVTSLQLWNGRRERQIDRAHQLKKDVYLEFVADYRESLTAFNHLSDPNFPLEQVTGVAQKGVRSFARLTLIAPAKTVEKLTQVNTLIASHFMDLMPDAVSLRYKKTDLELSDKAIQDMQAEQSGIIGLMQEQNVSGEKNSEKFDFLSKWFKNTQASYEEESKLRDSHVNDVRLQQSDLALKIMKVLEAIEPELNSLLAMIRVDIGIDEDKGSAFLSLSNMDHEALRQKFLKQSARVKDLDKE